MFYTQIPCKRNGSTFTKSYKTTTTQHSFFKQGKPQQKTNKKLNPTEKSIEGARVVIPYIKGLSETVQTHPSKNTKLEFSLKALAPSNLLFMHPKDPIPDGSEN